MCRSGKIFPVMELVKSEKYVKMKAQVVSLPIYGSALIYGIHMIAHFREIKNAHYYIFCIPPICTYALLDQQSKNHFI